MLTNVKKIHFVGIGGIGMSGLAKILLELGYRISGSDIAINSCLEDLSSKGAKIIIGHKQDNLEEGVDIVVYSSSIPPNNPELLKAKNRGITIMHRADILALLMKTRIGVAVTGSHGKTTTTALISHILYEAGLGPTVIVGGLVNNWGTNAMLGEGKYLVAETDESDGSFLKFSPVYTVVSNIDKEHLDYYKNIDNIIQTYRDFINKTSNSGCVFYCFDSHYLREIMKDCKLRSVSYGLDSRADIYPIKINLDKSSVEFECIYLGDNIGLFNLQIPGIHNIINAQAALAVAKELNVDWAVIKKALFSYTGTKRRFQIRKEKPVLIIDDYAHHPTEIRATLEAARAWKKNRIITVFQPHRYTRTFYLKDMFADAFSLSDKLILTDIYAAGEEPIEGISGESIYKAVVDNGYKNVLYLNRKAIIPYLLKTVRDDDLILMLGAGDINGFTDELIKQLEKKC